MRKSDVVESVPRITPAAHHAHYARYYGNSTVEELIILHRWATGKWDERWRYTPELRWLSAHGSDLGAPFCKCHRCNGTAGSILGSRSVP